MPNTGEIIMPGRLCVGSSQRRSSIVKESKAYCEGQQARAKDDTSFGSNPHADGTNAAKAWSTGWFVVDQQAPTTLDQPIGCCAPVGVVGGVATSFAPVWDDPIEVSLVTGSAYPIADLNDFIIIGSQPITFTIDTGALPNGITLNTNGTFSGTTDVVSGAGSTGYLATNAAGAVASGFFKYTVS